MIASLEGVILDKQTTQVIIQVSGVGYLVMINSRTSQALPSVGNSTRVITYLDVKEDSLTLFGFLDQASYHLFKHLISVNGVGSKSALSILDLDTTDALVDAIFQERVSVITQANGIGKKSAERIILELKEKVMAIHSHSHFLPSEGISVTQKNTDVWDALESLGYKPVQIQHVIKQIDMSETAENQIRMALKILQKK